MNSNAMAGTIYRSGDDGRTWQVLATITMPTFSLDGVTSFYAVPWDAQRVFIGADWQYAKPLVYRSTDGGVHWSLPWQPDPRTRKELVDIYVGAFAGLSGTHTLLLSDVGRLPLD